MSSQKIPAGRAETCFGDRSKRLRIIEGLARSNPSELIDLCFDLVRRLRVDGRVKLYRGSKYRVWAARHRAKDPIDLPIAQQSHGKTAFLRPVFPFAKGQLRRKPELQDMRKVVACAGAISP